MRLRGCGKGRESCGSWVSRRCVFVYFNENRCVCYRLLECFRNSLFFFLFFYLEGF